MKKVKIVTAVLAVLIISLSCQTLNNFSSDSQSEETPAPPISTATIKVDTPTPSVEAGSVAYVENGDVWLSGPDGTQKRKLATGTGGGFSRVVWSPNGRTLLLIEKVGQGSAQRLFIKDLSEKPAKKVADEVFLFAWAPDGEKIAYYSDQIHILNVTTEQEEVTITVKSPTHLFWNLGGKALLYYSRSEAGIRSVDISTLEETGVYSPGETQKFSELDYSPLNGYFLAWLYASEGGGTTALITPGGDLVELVEEISGEPTADWSSDGKYVVYKAWWEFASEDAVDYMHVVKADTAKIVFAIPEKGINPRWSPDSRFIAYTTQKGGINLINFETQEITSLLSDAPDAYLEEKCGFGGFCGGFFATKDNKPDWSPDGQKIIQQYKTGFYIVDVATADSEWFEGGLSPDWMPSSGGAVASPQPAIASTPQSATAETPVDTSTSTPAITQTTNADVSITINDTKKGDFLKILYEGQEYEIGPLEKGAYAIGPNNKFFVYCTNSGSCFAAKFGSANLTPIGSVSKDFSIIVRRENPQYEFSFLGDGPYSVQIFELILKQDKIIDIPSHLTSD